MTWNITDRFPTWGETGTFPSDGFFYSGGDQVNEKHLDALWNGVKEFENNVRNALTDIDSDGDGIVDAADTAALYKNNDIDSDGDGKVNAADIADSGATGFTFNGNATLGGDLIAVNGETIWDESNTYIPQGRLQNDSITVNSGDGLTGGTTIQLGGSTTLNVSVSDFAGTHLSDDGSNNLTVNDDFVLNSGDTMSGVLDMSGNNITGLNRLLSNTEFAALETRGNGNDSWEVFDAANNQPIIYFNEGGPVEVPNSDLTVQGESVATQGTSTPRYISLFYNGSQRTGGGSLSQNSSIQGMFIDDSGTRLYAIDDSNNEVEQYSLSTATDVTTISHVGTGSSTGITMVDLEFASDGSAYFISDTNNDTIEQFNLSTAWDITSGDGISDASVIPNGQLDGGMTFNSDGTKLYFFENETLEEWNLSTAYDLSTATFNNSKTLNIPLKWMSMSPTDEYIFGVNEKVQFGTPNDVSTARTVGSRSYSFITNGVALFDNNNFYIGNRDSGQVEWYQL